MQHLERIAQAKSLFLKCFCLAGLEELNRLNVLTLTLLYILFTPRLEFTPSTKTIKFTSQFKVATLNTENKQS